MWLTTLAFAAAPLDSGLLEISAGSSFHPGRHGAHELLVGGSLTARPWPALGLRFDGDLGLLGPQQNAEVRSGQAFRAETTGAPAPPGEEVDLAMFVEPSMAWPRTPRSTALLASQVILTPLRFHLGPRDLAIDLGVGGGAIHTADTARPGKDSWYRVDPDPARAQWHLAPVGSVGARLGLTENLALQLQGRGLTWMETYESGYSEPLKAAWISAGIAMSAL